MLFAANLSAFEYSRSINPTDLSGSDHIEAYSGSYDYNVTSASMSSFIYRDGSYITGGVTVTTYDGSSVNYVNIGLSFNTYIDPYSHTYFDFLSYDYSVLGYWGISGDLISEALYDLEYQLNSDLGV